MGKKQSESGSVAPYGRSKSHHGDGQKGQGKSTEINRVKAEKRLRSFHVEEKEQGEPKCGKNEQGYLGDLNGPKYTPAFQISRSQLKSQKVLLSL